jgi:hypothetical protein
MKRSLSPLLIVLFLLSGCGTPPAPPLVSTDLPTPAATLSSSITLVAPTASANTDPTVFGTIGTTELQGMQASALESVANAIFKKTMDGFVANGSVNEYQVLSLKILPGEENLLAEIKYNVKSSDISWLADGGAQAADGWINGNCSRFDFFITDTEFQLKNRRLCS